jgi:hypothetical protein
VLAYEEQIWQQRCSEQWLLRGDSNSGFFHGIANGRRRKCSIFALDTEDTEISNPKELRLHIEGYYKQLFGREERGKIRLKEDVWGDQGHLDEREAGSLVGMFSEKEIKEALDDMKVNSTPGPDGFTVSFYKNFWEQMKGPVVEMFNKFYRVELNLSRLNYGIISLIPKTKEDNTIKHYRPICLLGVDYKWFTKVLIGRLTKVAESTISKTQIAFIPGRNILEGVVILHEAMHEIRRKKKRGIIMKLDFEKAYDNVQWSFLFEVLERKRFPEKWTQWMKQVVCVGRVGINLNGEPREYFGTHEGLRQGDPLSPLLFNLVVDALATILRKGSEAGLMKSLIPELVEGGVTHLQYADDTIIFLEAEE